MLQFIIAIIVSASIDSTTLMIGDQTAMHLQVIQDKNDKVQMPVYGEWLIPGIEIVNRTGIDSSKLSDGRVKLTQDYTLTSFEDSLFAINPIVFTINGDTVLSDPLMLNVVQPFELDTSYAICDIKPIQKAPVWVWGVARWFVLAIFMIALGLGLYYILTHIRDGRRLRDTFKPVVPQRPAEEVALEQLDIIRKEKIWQNGREKDYHTQLTDVVREYIAGRFNVSSTEKTSEETLREMKPILNEQKELYTGLTGMLRLADLIKFAKWKATPEENENSLRMAYRFVNETTPKKENKEEEETL